jgi:hypothetical protein
MKLKLQGPSLVWAPSKDLVGGVRNIFTWPYVFEKKIAKVRYFKYQR